MKRRPHRLVPSSWSATCSPSGGKPQDVRGAVRALASLIRHASAHLEGDREQDHPAAVACAAFVLMLYQEQVLKGRLPAELDDISEELSRSPLCGA